MFPYRQVSIFALAVLASSALGCCVVSDGVPVQLSNEKVIIVWDEAKHVQHFIREAKFDTKAKDFGFIVPTPSVPTLGLANSGAYADLENLIPKPPAPSRSEGSGGASGSLGHGVEVIETVTVGDYKATIVRASDGKTLNEWLKTNGYVSRPSMENWLEYYAKQKWVFTAFKFMKKEPVGVWTQAIRVSFKTDTPRYPYKMPMDTWPGDWRRPLDVYFVAADEARAEYVGGTMLWEAKIRWVGRLPDVLRSTFASDCGLKEGDLPPDATVTVFHNGQNPDGYGRDLFFEVAHTESPVFGWIGGLLMGLPLAAGAHLRWRR